MQIVVLDGYTLNPGDLSWSAFEELGQLQVYDRTAPAEIELRVQNTELILTNKVPLSAELINSLPQLKYIGVLATGVNVVDLAAARHREVPVCNVPGYSTPAVAQLVFALLLELTHGVGRHADKVREGKWAASPDFSFTEQPLVELAGKTMGIVGYGAIGKKVADIARAFGMQVVITGREPRNEEGTTWVELDELFRYSDVVSLHCPLTEQTHQLVNRQRLALMKPTAYLINTGRGPLIDEPALAAALTAGQLAGAGLDVLSDEPPAAANPLLTAPNTYVTPHIAWATRSSRQRLMDAVVNNIRAFQAGTPLNVVNGN